MPGFMSLFQDIQASRNQGHEFDVVGVFGQHAVDGLLEDFHQRLFKGGLAKSDPDGLDFLIVHISKLLLERCAYLDQLAGQRKGVFGLCL